MAHASYLGMGQQNPEVEYDWQEIERYLAGNMAGGATARLDRFARDMDPGTTHEDILRLMITHLAIHELGTHRDLIIPIRRLTVLGGGTPCSHA